MARIDLKSLNKLIGRGIDLSPADTFERELTKYVEFVNSTPRKVSRSFKPSSMQCLRNMFYQLRGVEVTADMLSANDFSSIRMGEVGTDAHERIQTYLINMSNDESFNSTWQYYDVEQYIKMFHLEDNLQVVSKNGLEYKIFNKQYNIRFQTDGLLFNKVTKKFYVFEFKTETDMKFGKRNAVNEDHYNQGICYCLSFQIDTGVIFLYEGRDFLGHKAYYLEVTEQMKKGLTDIIHTVNDFIDRDELPPMCEKLKICQYCDYKKYCSVNSKGVREKE